MTDIIAVINEAGVVTAVEGTPFLFYFTSLQVLAIPIGIAHNQLLIAIPAETQLD